MCWRISRSRRDLAPAQRGRDRRAGDRPRAERRHDQLARAVLEVVHVDPAVAARHLARDRGDLRQPTHETAREQLAERARLLVGALPPQRHEQVEAGRAAGLHVEGQVDAAAELPRGERDLDDVLERRALGVEVEHAPVRPLERGSVTGPEVEGNRAEVDDVEQRRQVVADEVVDLPLGVLAPHPLGPDPFRREPGCILLKERLPRDAVGIARHDHRAVLEIGQQPGRDRAVVLDQVALGVAVLRPEHFLHVGELDLTGRRDHGCARHRPVPAALIVCADPPLARPPARLPALPHTLLRPLVLPEPEKHRLPQEPFLRPFGVLHLAHQERLDPDRPLLPGHGTFARRRRAAMLLQRPAHIGELAVVESGAHPADVGQRSVHELGQVQRAEAAARSFGRGVAHHDVVGGLAAIGP